jgi:hypothetical protein
MSVSRVKLAEAYVVWTFTVPLRGAVCGGHCGASALVVAGRYILS